MFDPKTLLRPHLLNLVPYSSARDDYKGTEGVFLDANENPFGSITEENWNRYPDPYQKALKKRIAEIKDVAAERIFLGNGSDEPIDLLFRAFCEPGKDNVIVLPPTYGMYQVSADINGVEAKNVPLTADFDLNLEAVLNAVDPNTKMVFVCSPNNPTGNDLSLDRIEALLTKFSGLVMVDEAYIDFADRPSFTQKLEQYPNLVVLQTFSKAWGLASLRLGMAFASEELLKILNAIKAPYNLSGLTQQTVLGALDSVEKKNRMVNEVLANRKELINTLGTFKIVRKIYPSDANFLLVQIENAAMVYRQLIEKQVIVRDRSRVLLCEDGLRITVGTSAENEAFIQALREIENLSE